MTERMQGKVVLISGAARGQGAAHARRLAAEGASVLCTDVLDELGQATAARIRNGGGDAQYMRLDVRLNGDWVAAVAFAEDRWGKLDVLVNNAGIVELADAQECSDDEWDDVIAVCQSGAFRGTRAVLPALKRAGGGSIVNISSVMAVRGSWGYVAYQAAKSAVLGITRSTAKTFGVDGIRANAICPESSTRRCSTRSWRSSQKTQTSTSSRSISRTCLSENVQRRPTRSPRSSCTWRPTSPDTRRACNTSSTALGASSPGLRRLS